MYYVYVLQSKLNGQSYVGSTNNLKGRFKDHNSGKVISTKRYKPWKLLYYEAYELDKLARMREKRLKSNGNAARELKKRIGFSKVNLPAKFLKSGAGFTLVELLIVIAIMGIVATGIVLLVDPLSQIQKAQDTKRKSDLSQIQKAIEQYYNDFGQYPVANAGKIKSDADHTLGWGSTGWQYMGTLPKDPNSSKNYVYHSTGQAYYIYASLDRGANDPQACKGGDECNNVPPGETCGKTCNYGVSSPNVSP